jgi:hypothetical protein
LYNSTYFASFAGKAEKKRSRVIVVVIIEKKRLEVEVVYEKELDVLTASADIPEAIIDTQQRKRFMYYSGTTDLHQHIVVAADEDKMERNCRYCKSAYSPSDCKCAE